MGPRPTQGDENGSLDRREVPPDSKPKLRALPVRAGSTRHRTPLDVALTANVPPIQRLKWKSSLPGSST